MAILTVAALREFIDTGLPDSALQTLLDGTEEMIVARAGAPGSTTELLGGQGAYLTTSRPVASITSITERFGETDATTLAADDWRLVTTNGYTIQRRSGGTNSRYLWNPWTQVIYTPVDDTDTRKLVQLGLIEIKTTVTPGITMKQIGAWTEQYAQGKPYQQLLDECLAQLYAAPMLMVI
jgi:hypothetical protein